MIAREEVEKTLARALVRGADFADIFIEKKTGNSIIVEDGKLEAINSGLTIGAGIRVISGEAIGFASVDSIDTEALLEAAGIASAIATEANPRPAQIAIPHEPRKMGTHSPPEQTADIAQKAEKAKIASKAAWGTDKRIRQVSVGYSDSERTICVADSHGGWICETSSATRLAVSIVAAEGNIVQTGHESPGNRQGFEFFEDNNPETTALTAANRALKMLDAKPAPTGAMPVVLNEGYGGVLLHEACGHGMEADLALKGASVFAGKVGSQVASTLVTAIDDPTLTDWWGSYLCDDEGTLAEKNTLIKDGIMMKYMHSRETARKMGEKTTGNGRRQSFRHLPIPRMSNTYIAPGKTPLEQMIRAIDYGFYAKALGGGQVNTINGDFVFAVAEGYMIEKGKITHPVRGATLIGNGAQALMAVEAVGSHLDAKAGMCGKDGQSVPVTTGQPAVMIAKLTVGGTSI